MSKLTPQDYLSIIEVIKGNNQLQDDTKGVEYWDAIVEKLYEEVNTLAYYSHHNLQVMLLVTSKVSLQYE